MTNKLTIKTRRFNCKNIRSFGRSSCKFQVSSHTLGSSTTIISFLKHLSMRNSFTTKALNNSIKVYFRTFKNIKSCFNFKEKLKDRFNNFSKKKLFIVRSINGKRIRYCCVENGKKT